MRRATDVPTLPAPSGPYSHLVDVGALVMTCGLTGREPATGAPINGIDAQSDAVFDQLETILAAAGLGLDHVVKTTVHLRDLSDIGAFNAVFRRRFSEPFPVRTTVGSDLPDGLLVEVDAMAARS
jgi:reactive intermediate/imine deaminase